MSDLKQSSVALLEKAIDDKIRKSQSKRDTTLATVTRVDNDGTTWVHVYGGADETPVRHMTSAAQVGDVINVTFSGLSCSGIGNVTSPSASQKQVQQVSAENAQAIRGVIEGLLQVKNVVAQKVSTRELDAEMATIISAAIDNATINALNSKYANINQIEAAYAKIDGANINTAAIRDAWVNNLLVQTGLLANNGTVFTLDAVQVDAANITTGTLDVRRLIVTRTIDGVDQKFVVNFDTSGNVTYTKLDGDVLGPQTVAAEKLVAHSITAEQLTIQNIVGTGGWINLANGTFAYGNPLTGQGITWDGTNLDISGSVHIGGSSKALSDMLTADDVTVTQNQTQTGYDVDIAGNTFSLVNGATGPQGPQGPQGETGATGPTAQWYYGTALTHTSGTATLATSSTAGVVVGAMYLNTATSRCYRCTAISGTTATWTYAGNLTDGVIDNIGVGGRNLLRKTGSLVTSDLVLTRSTVTDGIIEVTPTTSSSYAKFIVDYLDFDDYGDGVYTVSFDARAIPDTTYTNLKGPMVYPGINIPSRLNYTLSASYDRYKAYTLDTLTYEWVRYSQTFSIPGDLSSGKESALASGSFLTVQFAMTGSYAPMQVRNVKLERGNVATDWTPAPEDAVDEEQYIYIQAAQNAVSTNAPTEWVEYSSECTTATETDGTTTWSTPVWSTKRPTFCPAYPTVLVAKQRRLVGGTVTCTTPLIDDTTTVIDGGRLITGSVTANAIDATDLHVQAANIDGTLTASQINTEGFELEVTAIAGLGDQLSDISGELSSKASSEDMSALSGTVSEMSNTVETALGDGGTVEKLRSDVDNIQAHISLGTVGEGSSLQPAITLDAQGGSSDGFRNVITNTSMSFMYGNETVAEVNKDELDITRTKVTESMQLGNFMWIPLSDGSLAFKWVED